MSDYEPYFMVQSRPGTARAVITEYSSDYQDALDVAKKMISNEDILCVDVILCAPIKIYRKDLAAIQAWMARRYDE